jgi:hypothetical protein
VLLHVCRLPQWLSDAALEWYSHSGTRSSPVAQGSVLQLNLGALYREYAHALLDKRKSDDVPARTAATVVAIAKYIVHTRKLSACDELVRAAAGDGTGAKGGARCNGGAESAYTTTPPKPAVAAPPPPKPVTVAPPKPVTVAPPKPAAVAAVAPPIKSPPPPLPAEQPSSVGGQQILDGFTYDEVD